MTAAPQRVLLIQLHHLGDVLLTTPAIRAARRAFPSARIDFASNAPGASALAGNPHLDNILVRPRLFDIFRARYDAVVDMHSVPRTARIVAASRARTRIGLRGRGPRNLAYTQLLPREKDAVYMALQKLRMLEPLGVNAASADLSLEIELSQADREAARVEVDRPIVAISPVAKHDFKQWGGANWGAVADALAALGAHIVITHGPHEEAQAEAVMTKMSARSRVQGAASIKQLAALYEQCVLWLGNDGGPKHIASAVGTPTLAVYRRNLGAVWSDLSEGSDQYAINANADDVKAVQPEAVIELATTLLQRYWKT
jgi:heptosyltransferase-3